MPKCRWSARPESGLGANVINSRRNWNVNDTDLSKPLSLFANNRQLLRSPEKLALEICGNLQLFVVIEAP
jgi:hypothetical protein